MKNRIIAIVFIAAVVAGMLWTAQKRNAIKPTKSTAQVHAEMGMPVQTAKAMVGRIEDTLPVTGSVTARDTVELSSKASGKVARITAREGDLVRKGQVIVMLDQSTARANLRQAMAGLEAAQARVSQARTNAQVTGVQANAAIRQAQAALGAAQANYDKVKKGARTQERMMASSSVATAKAAFDNAQANLKRYKQLYEQGAAAEAQLDVAQTAYDVAKAQLDSAKENLSMVEEGSRSEDLRSAETQVAQAREMLRTAKANAGQNALRREDIKSAIAGVSQAKALVAIAQDQINDTLIRSPINGYLSKRMTETGQTVNSGGVLAEVVDVKHVYFEADVSEKALSRVKQGQTVNVTVDAFQGEQFAGIAQRIYPTASTTTRNFSVRVDIPNMDGKLRPGMFARGLVVVGAENNALLIPKDAVAEKDGTVAVFVADGKVARERTIKKGMSNTEYVQALESDIRPGDELITSGHDYLKDGAKIYVEN